MKTKIPVLILCALLFALCASAGAQQAGKIPRIVVTRPEQSGSPVGEALIEAFRHSKNSSLAKPGSSSRRTTCVPHQQSRQTPGPSPKGIPIYTNDVTFRW